MIYKVKPGQVPHGEVIGIILIDSFVPYIPGDVANAATYSFPVRFQKIKGLTAKRIFEKDQALLDPLIKAGKELIKEGVKAITSCCGYLAFFQKELASRLEVPVFLSSLLQVPFIYRMLGEGEKIGIICANSQAFDASLLEKVGIDSCIPLHIRGLENKPHFAETWLEEVGVRDSDKIKEEVVSLAKEMVQEEPKIRAILLECSCLPPYGAAVQEAVNLPVFDFITMINYVYSSVVKQRFH